MKKTGLPLFKLSGFEVSLDWSWLFLAILITWTLAAGYFPAKFPNMSQTTYLIMGIAGALGLFLSIILHEFCHSLVGRHYGIPITGIKLFIFGGIAEMGGNPHSPKAEFMMSIVGPLFSILLAIALYLLLQITTYAGFPESINGVISYLSIINLILGIFNLLPGFPLDGGRVLRAILWWWKNDLKWATRVATAGGISLGFALLFLGILLFIRGAFISGLWMVLLGFFLQYISKMSYQQLMLDEFFHGQDVRKYAKTNPITVQPDITIQELVDDYFYKYYHKLYPVTENKNLLGYISFAEIKEIPKEKWPEIKVERVMKTCPSDIVIEAKTDLLVALQIMNSQRKSRLIVVDNGELYGIITLKDMTDIISMRMRLENKE